MKSSLSLAVAALLALLLSSSQAQNQGKATHSPPPPPPPVCDPTHLISTPLTSDFSLSPVCSCIFSLNKKNHIAKENLCVCELICLT